MWIIETPKQLKKSAESGHTGSIAALEPRPDTNPDIGSRPELGKEKKKGEAKMLLEDRKARPTRRTLPKQIEVGL